MDVEQLKEDVRTGRIIPDRLVDLVVTLLDELQAAKKKIGELERQQGGSATQKCSEPFSVRAEEKRQEARGKKRKRKQRSRGGRKRTAEKVARAVRTEKVFPAGVAEADCWLSHTRVVWRVECGQAVLVARWRILSAGGEKVLRSGETHLSRSGPAPDTDPSGAVGTLSDLIADLSRQLAQALSHIDHAS